MAAIDMSGQRFGLLYVLERHGSLCNRAAWKCVCDCGRETVVLGDNLRTGTTTSCGCKKKQKNQHYQFKERHGIADTKVHRVWMAMRQRCNNPNDWAYKNYGGRGINICERWESFEAFLEDMGEPPKGHQIERVDNNKGYSPENCIWATRKQQLRNRRITRKVMFNGEMTPLSDVAEKLGIAYSTLYARVYVRKLPLEQCFKEVKG